MQVFIYWKITLHVSGVHRTHHQKYIKLYLQPLVQVIVSEQQPSCNVAKYGYRPHIPVLSVLCPQLNLLNPRPNKIPGYATATVEQNFYVAMKTQQHRNVSLYKKKDQTRKGLRQVHRNNK